MKRFFDCFGVQIGLLFACWLGGIVLLAYGFEAWECAGYQNATGRETKIAGLSCYVKHGDNWYSMKEYSMRLAATGSLQD